MDAAQITLYKNSVMLRVFDKLSSRCLAFNKGWALLKPKMNIRLAIRQRADLFDIVDLLTKLAFLRARATLKGNTTTAPALVVRKQSSVT